jgi:hypothetical protein
MNLYLALLLSRNYKALVKEHRAITLVTAARRPSKLYALDGGRVGGRERAPGDLRLQGNGELGRESKLAAAARGRKTAASGARQSGGLIVHSVSRWEWASPDLALDLVPWPQVQF